MVTWLSSSASTPPPSRPRPLLVDTADGQVVEARSAPHPPGTEVDPRAWLGAVEDATDGLLDRGPPGRVAGQQHGMVALDEAGAPVRDALLWNDTRSARRGPRPHRRDGRAAGVRRRDRQRPGRLLHLHQAAVAARPRARQRRPGGRVLLPHDFVSLHLAAPGTEPFTDRGDASGTGYFATREGAWRRDLLEQALGHDAALPRIVAPGTVAGETARGRRGRAEPATTWAPRWGWRSSRATSLLSVGTSGVASAISTAPVADGTGVVTGFADASGGFLPMVTTMNAAGILDLQARWLGVDHDGLAELALQSARPAPAGSPSSPTTAESAPPTVPTPSAPGPA